MTFNSRPVICTYDMGVIFFPT
uniref:Uncharacterized protein n=1 Tax=Rhizophora mucronata TaxID=61149 RepID=A0A2P2P1D3_RHIMU